MVDDDFLTIGVEVLVVLVETAEDVLGEEVEDVLVEEAEDVLVEEEEDVLDEETEETAAAPDPAPAGAT